MQFARWCRVGVIAIMVLALVGCGDLIKKLKGSKEGPDAGAQPIATATTTTTEDAATTAEETPAEDAGAADPIAKASNKEKIARFGDEQSLHEESAEIVTASVAKTIPPAGETVQSLPAGTEVTKVSEHGDAILVLFADKKKPDESLAGWVPTSAFTKKEATTKEPKEPKEGTEAAKTTTTVAKNQTGCKSDSACTAPQKCFGTTADHAHNICAYSCANNLPCPIGKVCEGSGFIGSARQPYCKAKGSADATPPPANNGSYSVGQKVSVEWHGSWYPAVVVAAFGTNLYRIHYEGYSAKDDETVTPARMRHR